MADKYERLVNSFNKENLKYLNLGHYIIAISLTNSKLIIDTIKKEAAWKGSPCYSSKRRYLE